MSRSIAILLFIFCSAASAESIDLSATSLLAFPRANQIRVRIFPHLKGYPPQGKDTVIRSVTFTTQAGSHCTEYKDVEGKPSFKNKMGEFSGKRIYKAKQIKNRFWLICDDPVRLVREKEVKSYKYSGALEVSVRKLSSGHSFVQVVNELDIEEYLRGVVPAESPASWPQESLRAQAVAARTYALFHIAFARNYGLESSFDVDDTVMYQAYGGIGSAYASTDEAISQTRRQVLSYKKKIIQAYFHADSGGHTEDASLIWSVNAPYCQGKPEPFDRELLSHKWSFEFTLKRLNQELLKKNLIPNANPVVDVSTPAESFLPSGRISYVRLEHLDGAISHLKARQFRRIFRMRDTMIEISEVGAFGIGKKQFYVKGRGFGHGVGMSQVGAKILAGQFNWKYPEILDHYYSDVELCTTDEKGETDRVKYCSALRESRVAR